MKNCFILLLIFFFMNLYGNTVWNDWQPLTLNGKITNKVCEKVSGHLVNFISVEKENLQYLKIVSQYSQLENITPEDGLSIATVSKRVSI